MSSIDLHNEEIGIKIVYYGPGLGGKTTSLQYMHSVLKPENRGRLISLATGIDRTLYFDFLPIQLPRIKNFTIRMSVYTVPGQVHYDATRKLVLQGADGVVFVADSQTPRQDANVESMENLYENLRTHGMDPETVPLVLQYNKRDVPNAMPVERLERELNWRHVPAFETNALKGDGVFPALKQITKLVLADLKKKGIYSDGTRPRTPDIRVPEREDDTITRAATREAARHPHDETGDQLVIEEVTPPSNTKDSNSFEFDVLEEVAANPGETSTTLAAAIINQTLKGGSETATIIPRGAPVCFSDLWSQCPMWQRILEMEDLLEQGKYLDIARQSDDILRQHLRSRGNTHASIDEALLVLGVAGAHYIRLRGITAKADGMDVSRADALFCLFFLTDVELRMQAAGLSH